MTPRPGASMPHSRACGIVPHDHGLRCHSSCPTCGGVLSEFYGERIYISGAIMYDTSAVDLFERAEGLLLAQGFSPVNPKRIPACKNSDCRRLPHERDKRMEHSWACYLRHDLIVMLRDCQGILMLPGWRDSHGAREEQRLAVMVGLDLYIANNDVTDFQKV